jgi:hypothetical protein
MPVTRVSCGFKAKDLGLVTSTVRTNFLAVVRALLASIMINELRGKAKVYSNGSFASALGSFAHFAECRRKAAIRIC